MDGDKGRNSNKYSQVGFNDYSPSKFRINFDSQNERKEIENFNQISACESVTNFQNNFE